ncbi:MAG: isoprenylcysteine carboxylmethyltransferase family protein [Anaerolineae bacterium]|nr:isoprenylcysteine carboxylmethyltransferase family protein [Anaerolineae bacterium]
MSIHTPTMQQDNTPNYAPAIRRRFIQLGALVLIQAALLFGSVGRLDWIAAWAYLAAYVAFIAVNGIILLPNNPALIAERGTVKQDAKGWDKAINSLGGMCGLSMLIVAGLDIRYGWSPEHSLWVQIVALALILLSYAMVSWAIASNRYFSAIVRIQTDRGQTVATGGPYRIVRHPGYSGFMVATLAMPFLFGSLWALVPAVLMVILMIVRTALEDQTLHAELPGYADYAQHTRYRLLPGVW